MHRERIILEWFASTPAGRVNQTFRAYGGPVYRRLRGVAKEAAPARRRNYRYLLGELRDRVPGPFRSLPDGASPFVFPILADDPAETLGLLRSSGVAGLDG